MQIRFSLIVSKVNFRNTDESEVDALINVLIAIDTLKLVQRIDARVLISKTHGAIVTHGQSIKDRSIKNHNRSMFINVSKISQYLYDWINYFGIDNHN
jgi:hypothetical protein